MRSQNHYVDVPLEATTGDVGKAQINRPSSACFNDGIRVIDMVISFNPQSGGKKKRLHAQFRQKFEIELKNRGLELEYEGKENSRDGKTAYIKVHATWDALTRQAEMENLQMPIQVSDMEPMKPGFTRRILSCCGRRDPFELQKELVTEKVEYFTDAYDRKREKDFIIEDRDTFFSQAKRIYLTWGIMMSTSIKLEVKKKKDKNGVAGGKNSSFQADEENPNKLKAANLFYMLRERMYGTVFPIHDGGLEELETSKEVTSDMDVKSWSMRKYLYECWARPKQWRRYQPLDDIRDYYGEKVGLYFAWIGFYTKMLVVPSVLGLVVFLMGLITLSTDKSVEEVCQDTPMANRTVCRSCASTLCPYMKLGESCLLFRISKVIDNGGATFFAVFMAVWAIVFLEFWKRYQAVLTARWDVSENEFTTESMRPDFQLSVKEFKVNPITKEEEPHLSSASRYKRLISSVATAIFFVLVVIGLIASVMVYKTAGSFFWQKVLVDEKTGEFIFSPTLMTSVSASVMNGLFIAVMTKVYMKVAMWLTTVEMHRTDTKFEWSFTYKVFAFQFVNFYGSLFYLSFIRGQFVNPPNIQADTEARCPPSGCLLDVSIQLAIIMTGKQALNNAMELGMPLIHNAYRRMRLGFSKKDKSDVPHNRWEADITLAPPPLVGLFGDYLEMIIQFGFITMFVPAFPLAPLFALINNIIEIRLDAYKDLTQTRRIIPMRAKDIEPWFNILSIVTKVAVITNAAIIALTSDFIDRTVYDIYYNDLTADHTQNNLNFTSYMDFRFRPYETIDWCIDRIGNDSALWKTGHDENCSEIMGHHSICYMKDYRSRDDHGHYRRTRAWYHVIMAKLAYILIMEHLVLLVQTLIQFMIPDVPEAVSARLQRESYLQRQAFIDHEFGKENSEDMNDELENEEQAGDESWMEESFSTAADRQRLDRNKKVKKKQPFVIMLWKKIMMCP